MPKARRRPPIQSSIEAPPAANPLVTLNKDRFLHLLNEAAAPRSLATLRKKTTAIKNLLSAATSDDELFDSSENGNALALRQDVLTAELDQILQSRTLERARHYLKRLARGGQ